MVKRRKVILLSLIVPFVIVLSYFLFKGLVGSAKFRAFIQAELSQRSGFEVSIGALWMAPPFRFVASTLVVSRAGKILFKTHKVSLNLTPLDVFRGIIGDLSIEKPMLRLNPKELVGPGGKGPPVIFLRNLSISDGELVLEGDWPLTLRSIHFSARNFNLAAESGLSLQAYLPWLDGNATLSMPAGSRGLELRLTLNRSGIVQDVVQAKFKFQQENGKYHTKSSGRLMELPVEGHRISGDFTSELSMDSALTRADLLLKLNLARLPTEIAGIKWPLREKAPAAIVIAGSYAIRENRVTLSEAALNLGTVSLGGKGTITLSQKPALLDLSFHAREVPVKDLGHLFPQPLNGMTYKGMVEANLVISGPLPSPIITGTATSHGVVVEGTQFALSSVSFSLPFSISDSSFLSKGARIEAKGLGSTLQGGTQLQVGAISVDGSVTKNANRLEVNGNFQIHQGGFSTRDQSKIGDKFSGKGVVTLAHFLQDDDLLQFKGKIEITDLELLWGNFYGNFKGRNPMIEVEGDYRKVADELDLRGVSLVFESLGQLTLKGVVRRPFADPVFQLTVQADELRPGGLYDFLIRDTFKTSNPILGHLKLAGRSNLTIQSSGTLNAFSIQGDLGWQAGEIRHQKDGWYVGPIEVKLPFRLNFPPVSSVPKKMDPRSASIHVQGGTLGTAKIPVFLTRFLLWNNSLQLLESVRIPIYGGALQIDRVKWNNMGATSKDLSFAFQLSDVQLKDMTKDLGWYSLRGTLSGTIPQVQWVGNSLRSQGEITLELFGGRVAVRALEVKDPFSTVRSIKMDARVEGIQLERASETFEFGRISGVLEGTVDDLVIQNGQPGSFRADLQSVKKSGVSQKISVEALNNLTVVSSGREASSLYKGLGKMFDSFRYSKLGFKAMLKNDQLTLRGVESRGGQEYLVVGSVIPPSVNVISHTQEIGFAELMRRLERISGTGKTK